MALFGRWGKDNTVTPAPLPAPTSVPFSERLDTAIETINIRVRRSGRELPTFVTSKIRAIEDRLRDILRNVHGSNSLSFKEENDLLAVVETYITDSLDAFLGVHPDDRGLGSDAVQKIIDQINMIDGRVKDFEDYVRSGNRDKLSTQSAFLDMRLG